MSTERNITVIQYSHAAFNAGDLNGVEQLTTKDAAWASEILRQAFHTDPLLNFIYGDTINAPGKLDWFFRVTFRLAALYGECFSTAEKDGVLMMLPADQTKMTVGKMLRSGLLAAPFKMGGASFVHIYQKFGFEVVSDKEIPTGGLHNWGMLRQQR